MSIETHVLLNVRGAMNCATTNADILVICVIGDVDTTRCG